MIVFMTIRGTEWEFEARLAGERFLTYYSPGPDSEEIEKEERWGEQ